MNFRYNKKKVIWSVIVGLIIGFILSKLFYSFLFVGARVGSILFVFWIIISIIIYVIWSLFEKKKR